MGGLRIEIGKNIKKYRTKAKMTQKDLAEKLGIGAPAVSNWENGSNAPDIETLFLICGILHVGVADLYGQDTVNNGDSSTQEVVDRKYDDIIELLDKLTPEQRAEVKGYIKCMVYKNAKTDAEFSEEIC